MLPFHALLPLRRLLPLVLFCQVLGVICWSAAAKAEPPSAATDDFFEIHVRPALVANCISCHGQTKQEGGLRLTTLAELLKGGESGPAIVPGKPEESLLIQAIQYQSYEMPPDRQLDAKVTKPLVDWIAAGAYWPKGEVLQPAARITEADRDWWCIQPLAAVPVPSVSDNGWCRNEIDRFILATLNKEGIQPAEEADWRTLQRRLHFNLTGLPPNQAWSDRYEKLVDHLLEDAAYGENQARFWLDLVRYAESDGYRADGARPEAHLYRDYVIDSFNRDKPYDRFVTEQLAGDEVDPGNREALIGTMFLRHWIYEWNQRDVEGQWQEILSDVTETTADAFLALGVKCARCHDHKFDPILQQDYYRLQAFFAPLQPREDLPVADVATRTEYQQKLLAWEEATEQIRQRLHEIEHPVLLKHATREGADKFVAEIRELISKRPSQLEPYEQQIASLAARQFDLLPEKLPQWLDQEVEAERQELLKQLAQFDAIKPQPLPSLKFVASDVGPVAPVTFIPDDKAKTPIAPGFPTIMDSQPAEIVPPAPALQSTGRRTALARWITDPKNPLTARVIVNRIWQQHFGRGLVESSSDFGRLGQPPTHPELLDWLSLRFMEDGWSLKKLHRLIVTSATFRQSSQRTMDDTLRKLDPQNLLLWRMSPRRLTGEEITDSLMFVSGELSAKKRAIYKPVRRNSIDPLIGLFDFPDRIRSAGSRHLTTTSTQALMLMNNPWMHDRAGATARVLHSDSDEHFVHQAYQRLFSRSPAEQETQLALQFLEAYQPTPVKPEQKAQPESLLAPMPHGGYAIDLSPSRPTKLHVPWSEDFPTRRFVVEVEFLLRSVYPDASVCTLIANWSGNQKESGWALSVTSAKSAFKPQNLILQFVGPSADQPVHYEVVASNLRPELNKPYRVTVEIDLADRSPRGIRFTLRDLSVAAGGVQVAEVSHQVQGEIRAQQAIEIGSRANHHFWDGLIHKVRLAHATSETKDSAGAFDPQVVFDLAFQEDASLGKDLSGKGRDAQVGSHRETPSQAKSARVALLHALLSSNEMIYVD